MKIGKLLSVFLILLLIEQIGLSQNKENWQATEIRKYHGESIFDIEKIPEEKVDIGLWALIIAKEYDPEVDIEFYLKKLDAMAEEIQKMLAGRTIDMDKFLAVKMYLYESGKWNQKKPYAYDLDDPLGNDLKHQLLNNYMDSRKGNCVSMPTLFLALMKRVDPSVPFTGVKVPLHLFCRLRDRQTGDVWNVETTNGANPARNQWYIEQMNISQTAVDSGLYLRDLSKKEYIAELLGVLISRERHYGNIEKALEYTDLAFRLSPNSDNALIQKGALIAEEGYRKNQISPLSIEEKKKCKKDSEYYINKAISLGWRPENDSQRSEYLESVKKEKSKLQRDKK